MRKIVLMHNCIFQHDFVLEWASRSDKKIIWEYIGFNQYDYYAVENYASKPITYNENHIPIWNEFYPGLDIDREDPILIQMVEEGYINDIDYRNDEYKELRIVEIPEDVKYYISELENGYEYVAENHRTWH